MFVTPLYAGVLVLLFLVLSSRVIYFRRTGISLGDGGDAGMLRVVPRAELIPAAMELARAIAKNPRMSLIQAKLALNASQENLLAAGLQAENEAWLPCLLSETWKSRIEKFQR